MEKNVWQKLIDDTALQTEQHLKSIKKRRLKSIIKRRENQSEPIYNENDEESNK
jgi:hypothetical protein